MPKIEQKLLTGSEAAKRVGAEPWQVARVILAGEVGVQSLGRYYGICERNLPQLQQALERRGYLTLAGART